MNLDLTKDESEKEIVKFAFGKGIQVGGFKLESVFGNIFQARQTLENVGQIEKVTEANNENPANQEKEKSIEKASASESKMGNGGQLEKTSSSGERIGEKNIVEINLEKDEPQKSQYVLKPDQEIKFNMIPPKAVGGEKEPETHSVKIDSDTDNGQPQGTNAPEASTTNQNTQSNFSVTITEHSDSTISGDTYTHPNTTSERRRKKGDFFDSDRFHSQWNPTSTVSNIDNKNNIVKEAIESKVEPATKENNVLNKNSINQTGLAESSSPSSSGVSGANVDQTNNGVSGDTNAQSQTNLKDRRKKGDFFDSDRFHSQWNPVSINNSDSAKEFESKIETPTKENIDNKNDINTAKKDSHQRTFQTPGELSPEESTKYQDRSGNTSSDFITTTTDSDLEERRKKGNFFDSDRFHSQWNPTSTVSTVNSDNNSKEALESETKPLTGEIDGKENIVVPLASEKGEQGRDDKREVKVDSKLKNAELDLKLKSDEKKDASVNEVSSKTIHIVHENKETKSKDGDGEAQQNNQESKGDSKKRKNPENNRSKNNDAPLLPIKDLKLGSYVSGYASSFTFFGVFVKIHYDLKGKGSAGYALLHKSQIRDERVNDVSELFSIGEFIEDLRVIQIDYAKGEVGLSLRKRRRDRIDLRDVPFGKEIPGTVASVVSYGAFIDVGANVNALLHVKNISEEKIQNIRDFVNEGDRVKVRIIDIDEKKKKMSASMLDHDSDSRLDHAVEVKNNKKSTRRREKKSSQASIEQQPKKNKEENTSSPPETKMTNDSSTINTSLGINKKGERRQTQMQPIKETEKVQPLPKSRNLNTLENSDEDTSIKKKPIFPRVRKSVAKSKDTEMSPQHNAFLTPTKMKMEKVMIDQKGNAVAAESERNPGGEEPFFLTLTLLLFVFQIPAFTNI